MVQIAVRQGATSVLIRDDYVGLGMLVCLVVVHDVGGGIVLGRETVERASLLGAFIALFFD